ncbi:twin-arginine translocase TatA/TatE family subunit [Halovenus sp. WSH3]|uniref:Twin-arginine translocase TatA/TatE family subunit n=1 Tax=Halovenus carboxidivorans TaxID=2692199 RepID=A0A6B0TBG9_9EURY|nr:twin-arginine translocase TatA/TatE family subunit [Halovenus carboxidivorans]MXR52571.1 twin-arginine translocase TatA/TatE family subunit [Halovenus carboxidivorans]
MATTLVPLFGPIPGGMEMFVILLIAVLLFGANKIPKLARSTGQAMGEFQKGRQQVEQELEQMEEQMDPEADVDTDSSTVDLDNEEPDEDFELDDETQSSS